MATRVSSSKLGGLKGAALVDLLGEEVFDFFLEAMFEHMDERSPEEVAEAIVPLLPKHPLLVYAHIGVTVWLERYVKDMRELEASH